MWIDGQTFDGIIVSLELQTFISKEWIIIIINIYHLESMTQLPLTDIKYADLSLLAS